jgi:hypothetical protein
MTTTPNPVSASEQTREISAAEFLESWPLYRQLKGDYRAPSTISLECGKCKRETSWGTDGKDYVGSINDLSLYYYTCHLCKGRAIYYLLWRAADKVTKVGQSPAHSASIPPNIEKRLGSSAVFYKRALTCRNEGFGLAAVAYFRRVVEDKTNELIDVVADSALAMAMSAEDVANIRGAKAEKVYEDKLKIAAQAMPNAMKPDGANPLQALFSLLSVGLHTQTEEECLQIADHVHEIFDYLFDRLRTEIEDRNLFVAKIKKMVGTRRV